MPIEARKTAEAVRSERHAIFNGPGFVARQLEALTDAAAGRPEKLRGLLEEIAAVKAARPIPEGRDSELASLRASEEATCP